MDSVKKGINSLLNDSLSHLEKHGDTKDYEVDKEEVNRLIEANKKSFGESVKIEKKEDDYLVVDKVENNQVMTLEHNEKKSQAVVGEKDYSDQFIKWFSELRNTNVDIAGGKGASLGEMYANKFPVPPGFVVTVRAFESFMKETGISEKIKEIVDNIGYEDTEKLELASKEIRGLIERSEMSKILEKDIIEAYSILGSEKIEGRGVSQDALNILRHGQEPIFVAVRSSATTEDLGDASFAGQQDSFLNIKGGRNLLNHIKKCFSSLYTARAMYYRKKKGFNKSSIAVVVQKMVDSEKSGVVFSKNPLGGDEIIIEAVFGLGEGIVSGRIKPDHYVVNNDLKVESVKVADKKVAIVRHSSGSNEAVRLNPEVSNMQVLNNGSILEIADYSLKLENHYGKPQDIEFAIEHDRVYIVQSRPITTLGDKKESKELSGKIILEGLNASPGIGVGNVRIIRSMEDLPKIKKGEILVTKMTNPDMVVAMQKSVAIITDEGGLTSHASIVSREMGIPAVVGTDKATSILKDGMSVTVDGFNGKIYEGKVAETQIEEIEKAVSLEKVKLKLIVDLPDAAARAAAAGVDSIGLLRLEGIIAGSGKHPLLYERYENLREYQKLIEDGLKRIVEHFKSVWIRTSDIRSDEYSTLEGAPEKEMNPMLGFHGIRFSLKHPQIFESELAAIKEIADRNPEKEFGVMIPLVISIDEVKKAKEYFNKFKSENMIFGVMIETPSSVQIIDDICNEVDFISFGTNDLTQFTLGVDRGNEEVQYLYNELHPAIFSQIKRVIGSCRRNRVITSLCGQSGSIPEMAEFLFRKGIDSISVNADAAKDISIMLKELEGKKSMDIEIEQRNVIDNKKDNFIKKDENNIKINENKLDNSNNDDNLNVDEIRRKEKRRERNRRRKERKKNKWDKKAEVRVEEIDDLKEIKKESRDIMFNVSEENRDRLNEDKKDIANIKIEKKDAGDIAGESAEELISNSENTGVYKPDKKNEEKKFSYDFEDF